MVTIKSKSEIEKMREACRVAALAQQAVEKAIRPGISTWELDKIAEETMRANGAIPAEKGYPSGMKGVPDFPGSICASINDMIIHGIPSKRDILHEGDIISIDLVAYKDGFNGDCCRTYGVGTISKEAQYLIDVTKQAFFEGIKYATKNNRLGEMHEDPGIPNYGKAGRGIRLEPGMTLAIEPMVVAGDRDICQGDDGWSIWTVDGSLSAHYENTILITEKGPEILTLL